MEILSREQKRALMALSKQDIEEQLDTAFETATEYHTKRVRSSSANPEHDLVNRGLIKCNNLYFQIERAGSLAPLIKAIDENEKANPDKLSVSAWSHALSGMAGSFLNLTLAKKHQR